MSEPFMGEVRIFGFGWPPRNWAKCYGQLLPINQNQALFSLMGTQYGGDGRTTFGMPDFRGRVAVAPDSGSTYGPQANGNFGGLEWVTISAATMPAHNHYVFASSADATASNAGTNSDRTFADSISTGSLFASDNNQYDQFDLGMVSYSGNGGQSHSNMQPSIVMNYCIALAGLFPPRN